MLRNIDTSSWGPVTVLVVVIVAICAIGGILVTIINPDTLSFEAFLNDMEKFVIGLGILGGARAVHAIATSSTSDIPTGDPRDTKGGHDAVIGDLDRTQD